MDVLVESRGLRAGLKLGLKSLDVRGRPELVDCLLVAEDGVDLGLPELQEAGRREGVG